MLKKILKKIVPKIEEFEYDNLYSSRSVIKNQYINKDATAGYYNEDIWAVVHNEIKHKIEQGITLYGEIVGFLPSGKIIQKGYDYGCDWSPGTIGTNLQSKGPEHKFLVYRITYTKPDGNVIEFSWQQIKEYCKKYELEHVKELFFGKLGHYYNAAQEDNLNWRDDMLQLLSKGYLEGNCKYCVNAVPAEGIVVRIDGKETYSAYKLKSKRFLERESKELDKGEITIEDEQTQ